MATVAQHTFVRDERDRFETPIAAATAINQGDMVFAGADGKTLPMSAGAGLQFIGVAEDTNPIASLAIQQTKLTVVRRGTFRMKTTVGDSYAAYAAVYGGVDAQTVTVELSGATLVGYVSPNQPHVAAGVPPILGAAGVTVDVIIMPAYPNVAA